MGIFSTAEFAIEGFGSNSGTVFGVDIEPSSADDNSDGGDVGTGKMVVSALKTDPERGAESARELGTGSGAA
jgi:hypothetical protein